MKTLLATACLTIATLPSLQAALPGAEPLAKLIDSQFDTNADNLIDAGEWQSGIADSFDKLDVNGDGGITGAEIDGLQEEIGNETGTGIASGLVTAIIKQILLSLDKNKDGTVSKQEYSEQSGAFFGKLDADTNGSLTQVELAALPAKILGV